MAGTVGLPLGLLVGKNQTWDSRDGLFSPSVKSLWLILASYWRPGFRNTTNLKPFQNVDLSEDSLALTNRKGFPR